MPIRPTKESVEEVEGAVLRTFKKEIPSIHFSDKSEKEYHEWTNRQRYLFHDLLHFPPKMFNGCSLIDFGAGTGENTIQFANWGARCTLVDMNDKSCKIAKEVFKQYASNPDDHHIICGSIFDYEGREKYDIVFSNGAIHVTDDKEGAFCKIASFVKPGGYLILGIGNKAGGFQNMLQRVILYQFAKTDEGMVDLAEELFKEDIDRGQRRGIRTRKSMIYDRFVVPKTDDPSISEVLQWFSDNSLKFYSSYPPFLPPVMNDSDLNPPTFEAQDYLDIGAFSEAFWMVKKDDDIQELPKIFASFPELSKRQFTLSDYVNDITPDSVIDCDLLLGYITKYQEALGQVDLSSYIRTAHQTFFSEVKEVVEFIQKDDLESIRQFLKKTTHLFRGANGLRHMYFIAYKNG